MNLNVFMNNFWRLCISFIYISSLCECYANMVLRSTFVLKRTLDLVVRSLQLSLELMASIKSIINELNLIPGFFYKYQDVEKKKTEKKQKDLLDTKEDEQIKTDAFDAEKNEGKYEERDLLDTKIKVVEFQWHDRIERISFPKPEDAEYLTEKSRSEFKQYADLSTAEKRMKQLLAEAPVFMAELQQIYSLSKWSSTYAFIHHK